MLCVAELGREACGGGYFTRQIAVGGNNRFSCLHPNNGQSRLAASQCSQLIRHKETSRRSPETSCRGTNYVQNYNKNDKNG